MEFGIEPHSLFQARGTTGNDHISATLPNASHRRAVFSVQCPARHSGVAPSADHPPPEATTTTTMANRRPARRSYSRLRDDFRRGGSRASNRLRPSGSSSCVWAGVINGCSKNAPDSRFRTLSFRFTSWEFGESANVVGLGPVLVVVVVVVVVSVA